MKIIIKKRRKKICQPLAGPDPPLPPAIFSENRRISFFFRFTLHRQYSLCSLFHFVAFSYISVWPHKQGAAEYEEEAKSRITVHRATKVNSLDFGFPRVATNLVHLGGDQGPGWRPDWPTWVATTLLHPVQVATVAQRRPGSNWRRCLHLTRTLCQVSVDHRRKYDYVGRQNIEDFSLNNEKLSKINVEHRLRLISHM